VSPQASAFVSPIVFFLVCGRSAVPIALRSALARSHPRCRSGALVRASTAAAAAMGRSSSTDANRPRDLVGWPKIGRPQLTPPRCSATRGPRVQRGKLQPDCLPELPASWIGDEVSPPNEAFVARPVTFVFCAVDLCRGIEARAIRAASPHLGCPTLRQPGRDGARHHRGIRMHHARRFGSPGGARGSANSRTRLRRRKGRR
jgi:hypothetical protein